jgi:hypothetical protein
MLMSDILVSLLDTKGIRETVLYKEKGSSSKEIFLITLLDYLVPYP